MVEQGGANRLVRWPAHGQVQLGLAGHAGGAQLSAEGDRAAAVVVGGDGLDEDGGAGGFRDRGGQDRGLVRGGAGVVLPARRPSSEKLPASSQ